MSILVEQQAYIAAMPRIAAMTATTEWTDEHDNSSHVELNHLRADCAQVPRSSSAPELLSSSVAGALAGAATSASANMSTAPNVMAKRFPAATKVPADLMSLDFDFTQANLTPAPRRRPSRRMSPLGPFPRIARPPRVTEIGTRSHKRAQLLAIAHLREQQPLV
jgi:hypothetical protein